jgi:hypothetical protein
VDYQVVNIPWGSKSNILRVKIRDLSDNNGNGKTGLLFSSTGLIIGTACDNEATSTAYTAAGSTTQTVATLGTYAAPAATKASFKEFDATNHPGTYELQLADARFAVAGAKRLQISLLGVSDMEQTDVLVNLIGSPDLLLQTTIATLADQYHFTLSAGSSDDNAYNGMWAIVTAAGSNVQKAIFPVFDYVGSTKGVVGSTANVPAYTIAVGDTVQIVVGGGLIGRTVTGTSASTGPFTATFEN